MKRRSFQQPKVVSPEDALSLRKNGELRRAPLHLGIAPATLALVFAVGAALTSTSALAGSGDEARSICNSARGLRGNSSWDKTIREYEESVADNDFNAKYHLAECHAQAGRVTESWIRFRDVEERAPGEMQKEAGNHRKILESKGPLLVVELPASVAGLEGLEVKIDGLPIPLRGTPLRIPVAAGKRNVTVSATGKIPWQGSVLVERSRKTVGPVSLADIEPPAVAAAPPPVDKPRIEPVRSRPVEEVPLSIAPAWPGQRTAALVTGGLGLVSLTVGVVFGVLELQKDKEINEPPPGTSQNDILRVRGDYATVANVGIATGAGLSAVAVILALTSTSKPANAGMTRFVPVVTAERGGMVLYGSF